MNNNKSLFLVVGLGKTGLSVARYLTRKKIPFVVYDTRTNPTGLDECRHEFPGVDVFCGEFPLSLYDNLSTIICSPGVPLDADFLQVARRCNIPVYGDIECLSRELANSHNNVPVIAITGTNGKSTVTTLVGEMARAFGLTVAVAGNIGAPVLDLLDDGVCYDLWVLELSSFQLDLTFSMTPLAATILNITADHLDRHHDMQSYIQAKQRVYRHAHTLLYNRADSETMPSSSVQSSEAHLVSYGLDEPTQGNWGVRLEGNHPVLMYGTEPLLSTDDLKIKGRHNWSNALAACALAHEAGIDTQTMVRVLKQFKGLPHRAEWVRTLNGVDWINDSKGTNVGATCSAISGIGNAICGKIVLIAGGQGKGADFQALQAPIAEHARALVLMGEDADKMEKALGSIVPVLRASSLEEAVSLAHQQAQVGDVVMLSPACASFDMFRDFNHRGEAFVSSVNSL